MAPPPAPAPSASPRVGGDGGGGGSSNSNSNSGAGSDSGWSDDASDTHMRTTLACFPADVYTAYTALRSLARELNLSTRVPQVCILGEAQTGKTTLLEAFVGHRLHATTGKRGRRTRRPMLLQVRCAPDADGTQFQVRSDRLATDMYHRMHSAAHVAAEVERRSQDSMVPLQVLTHAANSLDVDWFDTPAIDLDTAQAQLSTRAEEPKMLLAGSRWAGPAANTRKAEPKKSKDPEVLAHTTTAIDVALESDLLVFTFTDTPDPRLAAVAAMLDPGLVRTVFVQTNYAQTASCFATELDINAHCTQCRMIAGGVPTFFTSVHVLPSDDADDSSAKDGEKSKKEKKSSSSSSSHHHHHHHHHHASSSSSSSRSLHAVLWAQQTVDLQQAEWLGFDRQFAAAFGAFTMRGYLMRWLHAQHHALLPAVPKQLHDSLSLVEHEIGVLDRCTQALDARNLRFAAQHVAIAYVSEVSKIAAGSLEGVSIDETFAQTLDEEHAALSTSTWRTAHQKAVTLPPDVPANADVRLYGKQQFERLLVEFRNIVQNVHLHDVHLNELASAAGCASLMPKPSMSTNVSMYTWVASNIAASKAESMFRPLIDELAKRAVCLCQRLSTIALSLLAHRQTQEALLLTQANDEVLTFPRSAYTQKFSMQKTIAGAGGSAIHSGSANGPALPGFSSAAIGKLSVDSALPPTPSDTFVPSSLSAYTDLPPSLAGAISSPASTHSLLATGSLARSSFAGLAAASSPASSSTLAAETAVNRNVLSPAQWAKYHDLAQLPYLRTRLESLLFNQIEAFAALALESCYEELELLEHISWQTNAKIECSLVPEVKNEAEGRRFATQLAVKQFCAVRKRIARNVSCKMYELLFTPLQSQLQHVVDQLITLPDAELAEVFEVDTQLGRLREKRQKLDAKKADLLKKNEKFARDAHAYQRWAKLEST